MGLLNGTASFVRYAVEGDLPDNFWDFAAERIPSFAFRDIDDSVDEFSVGWVSLNNMFDSAFAYASYAVADFIVMSLRIDERRVSPAALKKFTLKEEARKKRELEVPKLSRNHRLEIKENVRLALVKKAVPVPSVHDFYWNLAEGTVLFYGTGSKTLAIFEGLFKDCFGVSCILQVPYLAAGHLLGPEKQERLAELRPEIFV